MQLTGEDVAEYPAEYPVVLGKSARWLRAHLRAFAGPPDRSGEINPPMRTGRERSPKEQKVEAAIRAINRSLNAQVLAKLKAERLQDKIPAGERPLRTRFPHLSQRAHWSRDLLEYAHGEVAEIASRMKLHLEREHRAGSGYG